MVLQSIHIFSTAQKYPYPYTFKTNDDVPSTLGDIHSNGYYVWDDRAVRLLSDRKPSKQLSPSPTPTPNPTPIPTPKAIPLLELDNDGQIIDTSAPNSKFLRDSDGTRFNH